MHLSGISCISFYFPHSTSLLILSPCLFRWNQVVWMPQLIKQHYTVPNSDDSTRTKRVIVPTMIFIKTDSFLVYIHDRSRRFTPLVLTSSRNMTKNSYEAGTHSRTSKPKLQGPHQMWALLHGQTKDRIHSSFMILFPADPNTEFISYSVL